MNFLDAFEINQVAGGDACGPGGGLGGDCGGGSSDSGGGGGDSFTCTFNNAQTNWAGVAGGAVAGGIFGGGLPGALVGAGTAYLGQQWNCGFATGSGSGGGLSGAVFPAR